MKLGVLGGSFDPIHLGHLRAAEVAREELGLDRVLFVPAGTPPHRPALASSARDRYAMVAIAVSTTPLFDLSGVELERSGPSYTVDTLATLKEEHGDDRLVLILGGDAYADFDGWREPGRIRELADVAVVARPGAKDPARGSATLLTAKGVAAGFPAGVVLLPGRLAETVQPGDQGTTFGGGPLACAAIEATLAELEEIEAPACARRIEARVREAFKGRREVLGHGALLGVRGAGPDTVRRLREEHRVLAGGCPGDATVLRLLPPLTLTDEELDEGLAALEEVLA